MSARSPAPSRRGRDAFCCPVTVGRGGGECIGRDCIGRGVGRGGVRIDVLSLPAAGTAVAQVVDLLQQAGRRLGVERGEGLDKLLAEGEYVDRLAGFVEECRFEREGHHARGREGVQEFTVAQGIVSHGRFSGRFAYGAIAAREQAGQLALQGPLFLLRGAVPQGHVARRGEREDNGVDLGQSGVRADLLPQAHECAGPPAVGQGRRRVGGEEGRSHENGAALSGRDIVVGGGTLICSVEQIVLPQDIAACKEQAQGYAEEADMSGIHPIGPHD